MQHKHKQSKYVVGIKLCSNSILFVLTIYGNSLCFFFLILEVIKRMFCTKGCSESFNVVISFNFINNLLSKMSGNFSLMQRH